MWLTEKERKQTEHAEKAAFGWLDRWGELAGDDRGSVDPNIAFPQRLCRCRDPDRLI